MELSFSQRKRLLGMQRIEITEERVYERLAALTRHQKVKKILCDIASHERSHYEALKRFTGEDVLPSKAYIFYFSLLARIFGINFALHYMERIEQRAGVSYGEFLDVDPIFSKIQKEEEEHEQQMISLIETTSLRYAGSFILGLSDAIVEITGTVAGLTIALESTRLIGMVVLIGGISAGLSMAGSEYLSTKEEGARSPIMAAFVTGIAYLLTVFALIFPYFVTDNFLTALFVTVGLSVAIIALFNLYLSIAKNVPFWRRFVDMLAICMGVAAISFGIGEVVSRIVGG